MLKLARLYTDALGGLAYSYMHVLSTNVPLKDQLRVLHMCLTDNATICVEIFTYMYLYLSLQSKAWLYCKVIDS